MSPLMIILLILILSICSSYTTSSIKYNETDSTAKNWKKNERTSLHEPVNFIDKQSIKKLDILKKPKREKLRKDLQERMSILVRRIIQRRRSKLPKKWPIGKNNESSNVDDLMDRNDAPILAFPVGNHLELGQEERKEGEKEEDDYAGVIGETRGRTRAGSFRNRPQESGTLMPEIREYFRARIRKVRDKLARIKLRINRINENETLSNGREKRASPGEAWIKRDFKDHGKSFRMHALVVRDQDIPPCCSPAQEITNRRYLMCSGAVLTLKHVITTASCMHFADVYKTDVQADLGVFVGATGPRAYVIKMNRYEMHPNYNYDVDAADYEVHNLAIIFLDCNIVPQDVAVPSLPKGLNDDVAHLCCGNHCNIFTIVQRHDNRHIARVLKVKHVPSPRHTEERSTDQQISNSHSGVSKRTNKLNVTSVLPRQIRSSPKLAAAPFFFGMEARSASNDRNSEKNVFHLARKIQERSKKTETQRDSDPLNLADFLKRMKSQNSFGMPLLRALKGVNVEKELAAVDWDKVEETMSSRFAEGNRHALERFSKNVVDETIRRLEIVLSDDDDDDDMDSKFGDSGAPGAPGAPGRPGGSGSSSKGKGNKIFSKLLPNKKNKTVSDFVKVFTSVVTSLLPPNNNTGIKVSEEPTISDNEIEDPSPIYQHCPPLGSPIIINETLIGLLAYTCDDVQNWVEWKYVNVAKNMKWLRSKISEQYVPAGKCSESGKSSPQTRSLPIKRQNIWKEENAWKINRNEYHDRNVGWRTKAEIENKKRNDFVRNFENVGIPVTETSFRILEDSWFARNSQPALQGRSNRPKISVLQNLPEYKFNTCYVKPDGNIDCATRT